MNELALFGNGLPSPFDSIKRGTEGDEWWSARDLMPMLGYSKWQRFDAAIDRAKESASVNGDAVTSNFTAATKVTDASGPDQADYRLTRYACYLVAMNGDPRKPEIAAAQTYFAVKTREAETAPAFDPSKLSRLDVLRMALESEEQRLQLEAKVAEDAPKVEAYDTFMTADGDFSIGVVAKMLGLGQNTLYARLRDENILITGGRQHNVPYQQYAHHFRVVTRTYDNGKQTRVSHTTYVVPSGVEWLRKFLKMHAISAA